MGQLARRDLGPHNEVPDTNAPILYGTNNTEQPAAVFLPTNDKESRLKESVIDISRTVAEVDGTIRNLSVYIVVAPVQDNPNAMFLKIQSTLPDIFIGLSSPTAG